jgi:hypothetical protein
MMAAIRQAVGRAGEPSIMSVEEGRQMLRLPRKITGTVADPNATSVPADPPPQEPQP